MIAIASALRLRLTRTPRTINAAIRRRISTTPTNNPAAFPAFESSPPLLPEISGCAVASGGAVGVIVSVLTWPVTVITDVIGVADHVAVSDSEVVGVEVVVGVVDLFGMTTGGGFEGGVVVVRDEIVDGVTEGVIDGLVSGF